MVPPLINFQGINNNYWGEQSKKEMSQIVGKVHKGGGVKAKIIYISNVDYFD